MTVKLVLKRCRSINAAKRLLPKIRAIYPNRKIIIVADGLYSNGKFINLVKELSMDYLLVAQHNDHVKNGRFFMCA